MTNDFVITRSTALPLETACQRLCAVAPQHKDTMVQIMEETCRG